MRSQQRFFDTRVAPVLKGGRNKVVVIISDGLRYEVAMSCGRGSDSRIDSTPTSITCSASCPATPSSAWSALLPQAATLQPDDKGFVHVDGEPSAGTENRAKLLEPVGGTAIQAETFLEHDQG